MNTPNRDIPYVPENTLDPAAGLNDALDVIDAVIVPRVIRMDLTAPPGGPADGDLYIPASPATGAWATLENRLVRYRSEGTFWQDYAPAQVSLVLNAADSGLYRWDTGVSPAAWTLAAGIDDAPSDGSFYARKDGAWESLGAGGAAPVVNTSASNLDALQSAAGNYTRFSHAGPTYTFINGESYDVGAEYHGRYVGVGSLQIVGESGILINAPASGSLFIPPQGSFTVKCVAADEFDLMGVTVPP